MKKLSICLLGLVLLTSCTKTVVQECTTWKIVDIDVPASSWGWRSDLGCYTASVYVPELTTYVCTDGFVQCYEVEGDVQVVLPYTRYKENEEGYRWEVTVDYEFSPGRVDFYCSASDFIEYFPDARYYRMVLHW